MVDDVMTCSRSVTVIFLLFLLLPECNPRLQSEESGTTSHPLRLRDCFGICGTESGNPGGNRVESSPRSRAGGSFGGRAFIVVSVNYACLSPVACY
jgi:hypothetical protein